MKNLIFTLVLFCNTILFSQEALNLPSKIGHIPSNILNHIKKNGVDFIDELNDVLKDDENDLFILVDKVNHLKKEFVPKKLVHLTAPAPYAINKDTLYLTPEAEKALSIMAEAAKKEGVTLLVSSTYRSYEYQDGLFKRYSKKYGLKEAERFSARPEATQHRLGTVIDFGSITDEYAQTKAGKWLYKNASKYGWSLSYPKGYEKVTGYMWECWHYRYLGVKACKFQEKYFQNIQQYMLEFIDYWKKKRQ